MKLQVQRSRLDIRKYFHSQRVVYHWNSLSQSVVQATSVNSNSFKRRLDNSTRYGHYMRCLIDVKLKLKS